MLIAHPEGLAARRFRITREDGTPVAVLQVQLLREGGTLEMDGRIYRIDRERLMSGAWLLLDGEKVVFEALKPSAVRNRFLLTVKGASVEISPLSWALRGFKVIGPDWMDLGTIRRPSWFSRKAKIDLSDLLPVEAQLFLFVLALVVWRRADSAGT